MLSVHMRFTLREFRISFFENKFWKKIEKIKSDQFVNLFEGKSIFGGGHTLRYGFDFLSSSDHFLMIPCSYIHS